MRLTSPAAPANGHRPLQAKLLLAIIAGLVQQRARTDVDIARNMIEKAKLRFLADGAAQTAIFGLSVDRRNDPFWRSDGTLYGWRTEAGEVRVRVTRESGRVDLNAAAPELLARLLKAAGADDQQAEQLAAANAGFLKVDHGMRPGGAEDDDFPVFASGLGAKNARGALSKM